MRDRSSVLADIAALLYIADSLAPMPPWVFWPMLGLIFTVGCALIWDWWHDHFKQ